jgi:hypothetical protein
MVISEVKMRIKNTLDSLVETYFNGDNIADRLLNSTLKIIVKQNVCKLDDVLILFADKEGEIDLDMLVHEYAEMIPEEGVIFDIKEYVSSDFIKNMLPDKVLLIKREDIMSLL